MIPTVGPGIQSCAAYDGTTLLGTGTLSGGTATLTTSSLAAGVSMSIP